MQCREQEQEPELGCKILQTQTLGTPPAVAIPVLPARSRVQEEQWDTCVPAGAEVGAGDGSWQCCLAWQGSRGPDLSGFENRMGTRRTFVFSLGAGTGPSGCSWDIRPPGCVGGGNHTVTPWATFCSFASFPFCSSSADPKAAFFHIQVGWGSSPGSTGRDEQLSVSLQLETPLVLTTAHMLGSPGRSGSLWCCSTKNVTVALSSTGHSTRKPAYKKSGACTLSHL